MKRRVVLLTSTIAILLLPLLVMSGCSGGSTPSATNSSLNTHAAAVVTLGVSPSHLGASETYQFTATVSNASDTGVIWSVSECTSVCGTISGSGLYTAPSFIASTSAVTVTATSHADATKWARVSFPLMPISVSVAPNTPGNLLPGTTRTFTSSLDHDPKNAGVVWTVSGAGCSGSSCGSLENVTSASVVYHAPDAEPDPKTVTLTATSVSDPNRCGWVAITVSATAPVSAGKYAFLINGRITDASPWTAEAIAGQFQVHADGNLTGIWDVNRGAGAEVGQAISGTYVIQGDGHGTLTINAGPTTFTYVVTLDAARVTGRLAEATIPSAGSVRGSSGYIVKQDESYFNLTAIEGDRVVAVYGEATGSHVAALGRFTTTAAGGLNNGVIDLSWAINENVGKFANTVTLTGNFGAPDATTGRGTAVLTVTGSASATYHFAYYIVSHDRLVVVQTDQRGFLAGLLIPNLSGEIRRQNNAGTFGSTSLNAAMVFHLTDSTDDWMGEGHAMIRVGQMAPNGAGMLSATFDQNVGGRDPEMIGYGSGGQITVNGSATGTYSVAANGRVIWTFPPLSLPNVPEATVAYLVDENKGYFMTMDLDGAGFGAFEPQSGGPFSMNAIAGTYRLNTGPPATIEVENAAGWMTVAADGTATGTVYVNTGTGASPVALTGTVTVASNGRGTVVFNTPPPSVAQNVVFWAISPTRWVALSTVNPGDSKPVLFFMERD